MSYMLPKLKKKETKSVGNNTLNGLAILRFYSHGYLIVHEHMIVVVNGTINSFLRTLIPERK